MDAIKKAQQLRLKEFRGVPFFKEPGSKGGRRFTERRYLLISAIAGLGALLLVAFWEGNLLSHLNSSPKQKLASIEKKKLPVNTEKKKTPVPTDTKNEFQKSHLEDISTLYIDKPLPLIKPFDEEKKEESQKKPVIKKKKEIVKDKKPKKTVTAKKVTPLPSRSQKEKTLSTPSIGLERKDEKGRVLSPEVLTHFNLGVDFYHKREILKAIQAYQKVIELDPTYAEAYNNLGIIYQEIGDFNKALEAYQKSVDINPRYEKAYNNLGILFYLYKRYDESIKAFQMALAINSNNIESHINLGTLFKKQGQVDKAIECYQKALTIDPLHKEAHYNIGLIYEQLENFELATSHYQTFINLSSKTHPDLVSKVQKRLDYLLATKGNKRK
jgi:tetratricopeptide (TPR) repeat protein